MDGTTNDMTGLKHESGRRNTRTKAASLMVLALAVGGLHLLLFNALDIVAPLGIDVVDSELIVIESDRAQRPMMFVNRDLDLLMADAR